MSTVNLISKTGIDGGNYKYWESKEACDNWFLSKSILAVEALSYIRPDSTTKNAYNAAAVHVPVPYKQTLSCDYITFYNDIDERYFHAQVVAREYVNEKSTRIYFAVDYVATFWDSIVIGKSFIERTHVTDDWDGDFTASKYLLPEPVPIDVFYRSELYGINPLDDLANEDLTNPYGSMKYNMITTVKPDGTINDPKINYQSGGAISGYLNIGEASEIEELMKKYVSYSTSLINRKDSILTYLNNIYVCPGVVAANAGAVPLYETSLAKFAIMFNLGGVYKPKHAKVYDCLRVRFTTPAGSVTFRPADVPSGLKFGVLKTGGVNGCYTARFFNGNDGGKLAELSTPTWPAVGVSATEQTHHHDINDGLRDAYNSIPYVTQIDNYLTSKLGRF